MDNVGLLLNGFETALTPTNLMFALLGVLWGPSWASFPASDPR